MFEASTKAAIIANGDVQDLEWTAAELANFPFLMAVDGGLNYCFRMRITPNLWVGDGDSVSPDIRSHYSSLLNFRFPALKDETDLELALKILFEKNMVSVVVYGALGNRMDHTMANIWLMHRYPAHVYLKNERETLFFITQAQIIPTIPGQTLSLIPFYDKAEGVTTRGLQWELNNFTFDDTHLSQSNICLGETVEIKIAKGSILCCLQRKINT